MWQLKIYSSYNDLTCSIYDESKSLKIIKSPLTHEPLCCKLYKLVLPFIVSIYIMSTQLFLHLKYDLWLSLLFYTDDYEA